jgi:hypothetical protein
MRTDLIGSPATTKPSAVGAVPSHQGMLRFWFQSANLSTASALWVAASRFDTFVPTDFPPEM